VTTIDVTDKGENLTLEYLVGLIESVQSKSYINPNVTYQPDEIRISEWQAKHIFTGFNMDNSWAYFRDIPLHIVDDNPQAQ
jgi:hypothetical protein